MLFSMPLILRNNLQLPGWEKWTNQTAFKKEGEGRKGRKEGRREKEREEEWTEVGKEEGRNEGKKKENPLWVTCHKTKIIQSLNINTKASRSMLIVCCHISSSLGLNVLSVAFPFTSINCRLHQHTARASTWSTQDSSFSISCGLLSVYRKWTIMLEGAPSV